MAILRLFSDLHLEFGKFEYTKKTEDKDTILLLAGDIKTGTNSENFIREVCQKFKYVVMVAGNHEFYGHEYYLVLENWKKIEDEISNFHFLNNEVRYFDGIRILGGTMWTSFANKNQVIMDYCGHRMNDYSSIKIMDNGNLEYFSPDYAAKLHSDFVLFLLNELNKPYSGSTVVMTHHSPGDFLKLERTYYPKNDRTNYAYYAGLNSIIEQNNIELWVHGHCHISYDYFIGNCNVLCNPRGYAGYRLNPEFDDDYIIELEE